MYRLLNRIAVLWLLLLLLPGASLSADPGADPVSITSCSFSPNSLTVLKGEPLPTTVLVTTGDQTLDVSGTPYHSHWGEHFLEGEKQYGHDFDEPAGSRTWYPPDWYPDIAGKTLRFDYYALGVPAGAFGSLLCSITISYGTANPSSGFGSGINPDYFLEHAAVEEGPFPDTR